MQPPGLDEHLADMRLRGLAESTTVYARERVLLRLAAWLACYGEAEAGIPRSSGSVVQQDDQQAQDAGRTAHPAAGERLPGPVCGVENRDSPPLSLPDATHADLLAWRRSLTCSPRSVAPYADHVRAYYDFLVKSGYRPDNPAIGLPVPRVHRGIPRPISESDLLAALNWAPPRVRPWLVLAGWAALRAKEIALLSRENVHDTAARPYLLITEHATKGHREREVFMSEFVLAELKAYGLPSRGPVFARHDGRPGHNTPVLVSKLANEALHASGTSATLHQLRHRCLTQLHEETRDLRLVQEIAGHASPATTAIYTKVNNIRAAEAMNALPVPGQRLRVVS